MIRPRDTVLLISGLLSVVVALVGLATHLSQLLTGYPMTSVRLPGYCVLGLAISGSSLTLAAFGRYRLVQAGGLAALAVAATLFLDKLSTDAALASHAVLSIHGSFATSVVLCLMVLGAALILMGMTTRLRQRPLILGFLGAVLIALPLSQLAGYLIGVGPSEERSAFFTTFLLTAPGHLLAAWAILTFGWHDAAGEHIQTQPVVPMLLIVGVLSGTLLLWQFLNSESGAQLEDHVALRAGTIKNEIRKGIEGDLQPALEAIAQWTTHMDSPLPAFMSQLLVDQLHGLEAIEVLDMHGRSHWRVADPNVPSMVADDARAPVLRRALARRQPTLSGFIGPATDKRLMLAVPLSEEANERAVLATYRAEPLFRHLLHDPLPRDVVVTVFDVIGDRAYPAYVLADGTPAGRQWANESVLDVFGANWLLRVTPNTELVAATRSPLPEVVLFSGLALTLAFVWVHYLARMATLRVRDLALEIERRQRAESGLQRLNEELEQRVRQRTQELYIATRATAYEKDRLSVTLDSIGDGVITTDTQSRVLSMNPVAENLTGWEEQQAKMRDVASVFRLVNQDTHAALADPVKDALNQGRVAEQASSVLVARDGRERIVAVSAAPIRTRNDEIIGVVLAFRDITQARRMEEELFKVKNLESIGVLAGGIAHDFNNLLTAIWGNVALAKLHAQPGDPIYESLSEAEKAFNRARDLTLQLLTFSKGGAPLKTAASIADLLRDTTAFVLRGSNVRHDFRIAPDLSPASIDPGQISQAINNLLINAKQAMPNGGTITVTAENAQIAPGHKFLQPGRYVRITIADQGPGIDAEHLSRIFEPYFTTKAGGSGLGLAITYSVIKKHQGHIEVQSQKGVGTRFDVFLPAAIGVTGSPATRQQTVPHGHGRVLLMDDEESIRRVGERILALLGYQVALASDGERAIEAYRTALAEGKTYDAVILDLTIPGGMGGEECARRLRGIDPHVRTIVSSGYSNNPIIADYEKHGFDAVVAKPYLLAEFATVLARVVKREAGE